MERFEPEAPAPEGTPGIKPKVLYVEDNELNIEVAQLNLRKKYSVLVARNDHQACDLLLRHGKELDVILMDIELQESKLNGLQLVQLIRGTLPRDGLPAYAQKVPVLSNTPVLFLTGYGAQYSKSQARAVGGDDLIEKPVDFVELQVQIVKLRARRRR